MHVGPHGYITKSYGQDCQGPYQVSVSRNTMKQLGVVKKQLIPVEQSRKVWIPQLLRTSKSSTQEGYFYHLLSVFHVKDSSD